MRGGGVLCAPSGQPQYGNLILFSWRGCIQLSVIFFDYLNSNKQLINIYLNVTVMGVWVDMKEAVTRCRGLAGKA